MNDRAILYERVRRRLMHVAALAVFTVAFVGLISGIRKEPEKHGYAVPTGKPNVPDRARTAPSYLDWRQQRRGPNADQYDTALASLRPQVDLFAPVEKPESAHEEAVARRAERRAYDGAPPTIPHLIDPIGTNECLACHERGARLFGRTAPVMSHPLQMACTQCHVPEMNPIARQAPPAQNDFKGLERYGLGTRAWQGAPPTLPHPMQMRTKCGSCHGPLGPLGLRTTHPNRLSCTQCHAPSAELDQRAHLDPPKATVR